MVCFATKEAELSSMERAVHNQRGSKCWRHAGNSLRGPVTSRCRTRGRLRQLCGRLLDLLNQHERLPQQGPQLPAFLEGFVRIPPMLQRVFVAAWSARSRRTAMHPTTSFSAHRRSHAGFARARFGPAAPTRQHWASITWMIACHVFAAAGPRPAHARVYQ